MMTKIYQNYVSAEEKNSLYKAGYRYIVEGDYKVLSSIDPWSGMPETTNNVYAFSDKAEAETFAVTQIWVFNKDIHAEVVELPEHTKTWDEIHEEQKQKEAERKAKRKATEERKAAEAGLTVEEYRKEKAKKSTITRLKREIDELEKELAKKKAILEEVEKG